MNEERRTTLKAKFELYVNKSGEFRWRPKYMNGKLIGDSEQGHKANAKDAKSLIKVLANTNSR